MAIANTMQNVTTGAHALVSLNWHEDGSINEPIAVVKFFLDILQMPEEELKEMHENLQQKLDKDWEPIMAKPGASQEKVVMFLLRDKRFTLETFMKNSGKINSFQLWDLRRKLSNKTLVLGELYPGFVLTDDEKYIIWDISRVKLDHLYFKEEHNLPRAPFLFHHEIGIPELRIPLLSATKTRMIVWAVEAEAKAKEDHKSFTSFWQEQAMAIDFFMDSCSEICPKDLARIKEKFAEPEKWENASITDITSLSI